MSTRTPPPRDPPSYAFVARMYKRPLRPIVMGTTFVGALWALIWCSQAYYDTSVSESGNIKTANVVLGSLFLAIGLIELFGFVAAYQQRIGLARTYAYLSIVVCLLATGAEAFRLAVYFLYKQSLINSCTQAYTGADVEVRYGPFWGSFDGQTLTQSEAQSDCESSWNKGIWTTIIWLIVAILVSGLFASIAFSLYHQLLSPARITPSQAYNLNTMPQQPYNPQSGYQYPAPPGPPPGDDFVPPYDPAKVPDYYEGSGYNVAMDSKDGKASVLDRDDPFVGGYSNGGGRGAVITVHDV